MWELDYKENWAPKNWCFWTVVLEKSLESPLDCREFQPVHPKGNESLIFIGRTDAEAETPILWPPDAMNWLFWKDPDAGKDWRWEEKGTTEDEIVWWYHRLIGHESEQTLGVGEGQGSLACCSPWGRKESDTTEWLNWTDLSISVYLSTVLGFSCGSASRVCLQCRTDGFDPWVGKIPWRRVRQPTPVFLPGKSLGHRRLMGYSPWGHKE